jgi:uncharacterized DUF497 family protein
MRQAWRKQGRNRGGAGGSSHPYVSDPLHSGWEVREFAVGVSPLDEHPLVVVFTRRVTDKATLLRPVSARYMHDKEFAKYERTRPE